METSSAVAPRFVSSPDLDQLREEHARELAQTYRKLRQIRKDLQSVINIATLLPWGVTEEMTGGQFSEPCLVASFRRQEQAIEFAMNSLGHSSQQEHRVQRRTYENGRLEFEHAGRMMVIQQIAIQRT